MSRSGEENEATIRDRDARLDEALEMTFPASDPLALSRDDIPARREQAPTSAPGGELR